MPATETLTPCKDRPDVDDEMLAHHAYDIDGRGTCGLCGATS